MELHNQRDDLLAKIKTWQATGKEITKRLPAFSLAEKLVCPSYWPGRAIRMVGHPYLHSR